MDYVRCYDDYKKNGADKVLYEDEKAFLLGFAKGLEAAERNLEFHLDDKKDDVKELLGERMAEMIAHMFGQAKERLEELDGISYMEEYVDTIDGEHAEDDKEHAGEYTGSKWKIFEFEGEENEDVQN